VPRSKGKAVPDPAATPWRARAGLLAFGVVAALVTGEIAVRALVPRPPQPRTTLPPDSPWIRTPDGARIYIAGSSFSHFYDVTADRRGYFGAGGRIDYRINNLGLRGGDVAVPKPPGTRRILCLGDSFTFGEGVREDDAWPQRLGRALGPSTQVINAGIQGYDLDAEMAYLYLYGRKLAPDVVILAFFMNDAMSWEQTISDQAFMTAPAAPSGPARYSALWRFLGQRGMDARQTRRYVDDLRQSFTDSRWRETRARIPRLRQMADVDGFRILAVIFPLLYELDGDYPLEREAAEVRSAFAEAGIEVIDLLDSYRGRDAAELWAHPTDPHPNEIAHAIAAEVMARKLASSPAPP
jgi:lysophospholipase L1-like esterase